MKLKCVGCKYNNDCTKAIRVEMENCTEYYPLTNADRIRAMTDEELAIFISDMSRCDGCKAKSLETAHPCKGLYVGCKGNWLDWLKQDAERSEDEPTD